MAPIGWSDLPSGILSLIAKLADSDIDLLRIRSVCSSWRSSLSPPPRKNTPVSFPLKLPPRKKRGDEFICFGNCNNANHGSYNLLKSTLYRLSSPIDPSVGWMIKVSETNPNTFSLLIPLSTSEKLRPPPRTIPNTINLLEYRISEISMSYRLQPVNCQGSSQNLFSVRVFDKVISLFNYVVGCDFAVLGLEGDGALSYWRFGDESWTIIDTKGHFIVDVIFCGGRCYAIDGKGLLLALDSSMQLTGVIASSHGASHTLIECDSDLYMVSETCGVRYEISPGFAPWYIDKMKVSKLNKCNGGWDCVEDLGEKIFLLCKDGSVAVSAKDFHGCKGNCVYSTGMLFEDIAVKTEARSRMNQYGDGSTAESRVYGDQAIIYHFDKKKTFKMHEDRESRKLYWPPPSWLVPNQSSAQLQAYGHP